MPTRVGVSHTGHTTITFDTERVPAISMIPLGTIWAPPIREESRIGFGFVCRFDTFRFSTSTRRSDGRASMTRPRFPRSLPVRIWTRSPFFTFIFCATYRTSGAKLTIFMKFLSRSSRATGPKMRVPRGLDWASMRTAAFSSTRSASRRPAEGLLRPDDDGPHDLALLDRALRRGRLHGSNDRVAHPRVAPVRAPEHADAESSRAPVLSATLRRDSCWITSRPRPLPGAASA